MPVAISASDGDDGDIAEARDDMTRPGGAVSRAEDEQADQPADPDRARGEVDPVERDGQAAREVWPGGR